MITIMAAGLNTFGLMLKDGWQPQNYGEVNHRLPNDMVHPRGWQFKIGRVILGVGIIAFFIFGFGCGSPARASVAKCRTLWIRAALRKNWR